MYGGLACLIVSVSLHTGLFSDISATVDSYVNTYMHSAKCMLLVFSIFSGSQNVSLCFEMHIVQTVYFVFALCNP